MSDLTIVAWRPTARETTHKEGRRISFGLSRNLQALVGTLTLIAVVVVGGWRYVYRESDNVLQLQNVPLPIVVKDLSDSHRFSILQVQTEDVTNNHSEMPAAKTGTTSRSKFSLAGTWEVEPLADPGNALIGKGTFTFVPQPDGSVLVSAHFSVDTTTVFLQGTCVVKGKIVSMSFKAIVDETNSWSGAGILGVETQTKMTGRLQNKRGEDVPLVLVKQTSTTLSTDKGSEHDNKTKPEKALLIEQRNQPPDRGSETPGKVGQKPGQCSPSCDKCTKEGGAYRCSSCTVRASDLLEPNIEYYDLNETTGLRFACYPLVADRSYKVRAQGTITTNFTSTFPTGAFYVGDDIGNGKKVQWWFRVGYKFDGDGTFDLGHEESQYESRSIKAAWAEKAVTATSSKSIRGYIYVERNQISPSLHGALSLYKDFVINITPEEP
jgi:hypothetical protein